VEKAQKLLLLEESDFSATREEGHAEAGATCGSDPAVCLLLLRACCVPACVTD